jgi:hypothetical protein
MPGRDLKVAFYTNPCGACSMFLGLIWRMRSSSGVTEAKWEKGGDFSLAKTPNQSPPDVKTHHLSKGREAAAMRSFSRQIGREAASKFD